MPIIRLASSCAWNVPSSWVKKPSGSAVRGDFAPDGADHLRHVGTAVGIGEHHDAAAAVLPQDLVRAVGLADIGDLPDRNPADRRLDAGGRRASA